MLLLDGFAHRGILEGSAQILAIAKEEINKALIKNPKYKVKKKIIILVCSQGSYKKGI